MTPGSIALAVQIAVTVWVLSAAVVIYLFLGVRDRD